MRRIISGIMLTLLFVFMLTLAFNIQPVEASETIYIRADGSIEGTTDISTVDNVTYTFTDNIYDQIVVERDNIILDGAGYPLQGTGALDFMGISLDGRSNVTIKNMEIKACDHGIHVYGSSNNTISGNTIINNYQGIRFQESSSNTISGNNITTNDYGIFVGSSSNNTISGNNITHSQRGIRLEYSSNNSISGNNITKSLYGIVFSSSLNNAISGNNVTNNQAGILLGSSSNNIISGNTITANNWYGMTLVDFSNNNTISGNNMTENKGSGISLGSSSNNTMSGNNITNNADGIYLEDSHNNTMSGNNITTNNLNGITVIASSNNTISGNNVTNNVEDGIWLYRSHYNTISGNTIAENVNRGIKLTECSNNIIYHNNFIDNTQQVYDYSWDHPDYPPSINIWDDGYPSGGNYWSDYTDVDLFSGPGQDKAGSDGIWDYPYVIDYDNLDRYPFTQQDGWEAPSIPPDLTVFDPEIDGLTVTVNGVVLPGTPGTTITRTHWDWGDGNSEDHWFPASHTYADYGDYTIAVTAYQSDGLTSTKTKQVSLPPPGIPQEFHFRAWIDGSDWLYIRANEVWYVHRNYQYPGIHPNDLPPGGHPTYINDDPWYPEWPDDWGYDDYGQRSLNTYTDLYPPLYNVISFTVIEARYSISIVQFPSIENDYTTIILLDDDPLGGAVWYEFNISYALVPPPIPPDLTIFHPEIDGLTVTINGVVLPGTAGTTVTRIHWDWGDGNSEDHWFPASHTYADYGDYTITVTAYQSDGLTSTKTKQVSLRPPTEGVPEVHLGTILLTSIAFVAYVAVAKWRRKREHHNL